MSKFERVMIGAFIAIAVGFMTLAIIGIVDMSHYQEVVMIVTEDNQQEGKEGVMLVDENGEGWYLETTKPFAKGEEYKVTIDTHGTKTYEDDEIIKLEREIRF